MKKRLLMILMMLGLSIGFAAFGAQTIAAQDTDGDGVPDSRDNCRTTPNPEIIAFAFNGDVQVWNSNLGGNSTNVTNLPGYNFDPKISADARKVVFASFRDGRFEIYVVNVDGSNLHRVTSTVLDETEPAFSRDGSKIAFSGYSGGSFRIYVMNADGSGTVQVSDNAFFDAHSPAFSPDGSKVAFSAQGNIWVNNADGSGALMQLTSAGGDDPSYSRDGSQIVFSSARDNPPAGEIYKMNSNGTGQTRLTNSQTNGKDSPAFSPNGSKIVYHLEPYGTANNELWIMNSDGGSPAKIFNDGTSTSWGGQLDSNNDGIGDACQDSTPPVITPSVTGTLGNNNWYRSNVQVSWSVTDAESSQTGCGAQTVSTDTSGVTFTCSATSVGGTGSQSVTVKRDASAPIITFLNRTAPSGGGWNNSNVTVNWSCSDALSGATSSGDSETLSSEGANQTATGTCADNAGNTASNTQTGIFIDKTAPSIGFVSRTAANSNGWNNTNVVLSWSCADSLSGVVNSTVNQTLSSEGSSQSSTGTCTDIAGNSATNTQTGINIDKTAPSIIFVSRTAPNAAGWNNVNVTVLWICTDSLSGAVSPAVAQTISTEGVNLSATGTCFDNAGNSASNTQSGIKIDKTAPTMTLKPFLTPFPNDHKYRSLRVADIVASVSDNLTGLSVNDVVIEIVTSDEVDNAAGNDDGNTIDDILIGTNCKSLQLRGERDGTKNGRVYVVTLLVRDAADNVTRAEYKVSVPVSQNGSPAVQDAAMLTRTSTCQ
jgi:Tol biopolymer transport system component